MKGGVLKQMEEKDSNGQNGSASKGYKNHLNGSSGNSGINPQNASVPKNESSPSDAQQQLDSNKLGGGGNADAQVNPNDYSGMSDAQQQLAENDPFKKLRGKDSSTGDKTSDSSLSKDGLKDQVKDGVKDKAKDGLKDKAKDGLKNKAKDKAKDGLKDQAKKGLAKEGASKGGGGALKGAAVPTAKGAVIGAAIMKAVSTAAEIARGLLNSAPVMLLTQVGNAISGAASTVSSAVGAITSTVTGAVNGAINAVTGVLGINAVVSGVLPTIIVTATVAIGTGTVVTPIIVQNQTGECVIEDTSVDRTGGITEEMRAEIIEVAMVPVNNKVPYVWGGTDWENGMDCSGLTLNVFKRIGIELPRTAADQSKVVTKVSKDEAQIGDLVFWGAVGESTHVAIYIGNNQIIEEPKPTLYARVRDLESSDDVWFGALDGIGKDDGDGSTSGGEGNVDYNVVGSPKYEVGKAIFEKLVNSHGFSGSGAAGAVGNALRESRLDPKADNPSGGVHGIFQWSGWSNTINGNRWDSAPLGKVDTIENELGLLQKELNGSYKKVKTIVGKSTNVEDAASDFAIYYEGLSGGSSNPQFNAAVTMEGAKWAYKEFGGANINYDEGLINSDDDDTASNNSNIAENSKDDGVVYCNTSDDSDGNVIDGTGSTDVAYGFFKQDELPEGLKPYAKDPRDVGLVYSTGEGWYNSGGQCVHLASSYFHAIWEGSPSGIRYPGGKDATNAWASAMGGEVTKVPKSGAIASVPAFTPHQSLSEYGHTFVVQHVFANGDILIVEQNIKGYSGDNNGQPNTWNYRLMKKADYVDGNFTFYTPTDSEEYKLKWK